MQYAAAKLTVIYALPVLAAFCLFVFWHNLAYVSFSGNHWELGLLETTGWVDYNPDVGITSFRAYLYPECFISVTGSSLLAVIVADFAVFYLVHFRKQLNRK